MAVETIIKIKNLKGGLFTTQFIEQFSKDWDNAVSVIRKADADLSKIVIVEQSRERG